MNEQNTLEQSFKLTGILKKVLYKNEENKYIIAVLENDQKICGVYFDAQIDKIVGEEIVLEGNWIKHKKYGIQFEFNTLVVNEAEMFFFLTKIVKGISKKFAKELLKKYTEEELINILDNDPNVLLKFKGIKEKKLKTIILSWKKFKHLRLLGTFLSQYNISSNLINKIYSHFLELDNLIDKIKENPYILVAIKGIGFRRADEIARLLDIDEKSDFRIKACLLYSLNEHCDKNGNSSIAKKDLFKLLDDLLHFTNEETLYEISLLDMLAQEEIHQTTANRYSPAMLYFAEKKIMNFFDMRKNDKNPKIINELDKYLENKKSKLEFKLDKEQKQAVKLVNEGHKTLFLIGYAGTGKSTSSRAILDLLQEVNSYDDIITIALSGIASQRIADTTGYKSATIQSLLIKHKEDDFFPYKVILLDEASMVNCVMFYKIISKISDDCIFVIVGDDGQLPAIGAGNVLCDSINFELAPICKLTQIHRQNNKQAITTIANEIRQGKIPKYDEEYEDFKFINVSIPNHYSNKSTLNSYEYSDERVNNSNDILTNILNISVLYIKQYYDFIKNKNIAKALSLYQVITPMKAGILGVININIQLQKLFNTTKGKGYATKLYEYKLTDKVIHIKNENMKAQNMTMYKDNSTQFLEKRIFNGQLGFIIKLDFENNKCIVLYPNDDLVVFYDFDSLNTLLNLAYCLTIHKTQGMEYENALIPMSFSHSIMHNTKLLYTAITRAKKMCYIIGEEEAFKSACKKIESTKRESVINDLLK